MIESSEFCFPFIIFWEEETEVQQLWSEKIKVFMHVLEANYFALFTKRRYRTDPNHFTIGELFIFSCLNKYS